MLLVALVSTVLTSAPVDLTGRYEARGTEVALLQTSEGLYVSYDDVFGPNQHLCSCLSLGKGQAGGPFTFGSDSLNGQWSVRNGKLVFESAGEVGCCGAGWPGLPDFELAKRKPPMQCTVKAARAVFSDSEGEPTRAYVVRGDKVEAVNATSDYAESWLARFHGPKRDTVGLLKKRGLTCTK